MQEISVEDRLDCIPLCRCDLTLLAKPLSEKEIQLQLRKAINLLNQVRSTCQV